MALDDRLDLYEVKAQFERFTEWLDLGAIVADLGFLRRARRALLPLPLIDRPRADRPLGASSRRSARGRCRSSQGKRVALVASGGGGAAVALVGVARAFEEAGVEPAEIIGCSGGAIWGSMWAAGMSADEMADFSLSWRPEDYLDIQWLKLPRFALSALRGFTGLAKGEAIERLFDTRLSGMPCGETPIPITTIVYNMDLGRVEYFGIDAHARGHASATSSGWRSRCRCSSSRFPYAAISTWTAGSSRTGRHSRRSRTGGFDHVIGVNLMLPKGFEPEGHQRLAGSDRRPARGEPTAPAGLPPRAGAAGASDELGEKLKLIEPIDDAEIRGVSFYDLFLDRTQWPRLIRQGYESATRVLQGFR